MNLKQRVWSILEAAEEGDRLSRAVDICILSLIFLNVLAVILGSVPSIQKRFSSAFSAFELFSVVVFTIEYLGRLWSCVVDGRYRRSRTAALLKQDRDPVPQLDVSYSM